jgi:hypothetical protein
VSDRNTSVPAGLIDIPRQFLIIAEVPVPSANPDTPLPAMVVTTPPFAAVIFVILRKRMLKSEVYISVPAEFTTIFWPLFKKATGPIPSPHPGFAFPAIVTDHTGNIGSVESYHGLTVVPSI